MTASLRTCGCRILREPDPRTAPFQISFETPDGERMGIVAYAFRANQRTTRNRPLDEHRLQVKYGSKDGQLHEIWQDPYQVYTTLFLGINPELGFFVGADPALHSPTRMFISIEFKQRHASEILRNGWNVWERDRRSQDNRPVEVLVGGTPDTFLDYIRFERACRGESQGHRQLVAEKAFGRRWSTDAAGVSGVRTPRPAPSSVVHVLAEELSLGESEVLDLIQSAPRLKMAVRGWVAEEHLFRQLSGMREISGCSRIREEGGADVLLRFAGQQFEVECKNVLRKRTAAGLARVDFQRTRASKNDPCSRYYRASDFDLVAACLHAVTEKWEFSVVNPANLDPHKRCPERISNLVRIDSRWSDNPCAVLNELVRQ